MKEYFYFDNAATTWPKPEPVYRFMDAFYRSHGVNPGRTGFQLSAEAETMIFETRRMLAAFFGFGGDPNRVVFSLNATDSMNTSLGGLVGPEDHLVITRTEHNSVLRPANHLERDHGVSVTRVERDGAGQVDPADIRRSITPRTKAVVVNHASNVLGSLQDIEAIGAVVRETDALFIVDVCQTAGVVPTDMNAWGIDVLVFTGHKGLFGPMGIGGMIVGEGVDIRPARVGGTGVDSITPFQPDGYPHRLEAGTLPLPGIAGLNAAQNWFADLGRERIGAGGADGADHGALSRAAMNHIHAMELGHVSRLVDVCAGLDNVRVYGPSANAPRVATLSINIGDLPAEQVASMLDADHGVCVRPGLHCAPLVHEDEHTTERKGTVRFSPGFFTDEEDLVQAEEGIRDISAYAASRG